MALKTVVADNNNVHHLIIGLNREDVETLLAGDVFALPIGVGYAFTEESDIILVFEETDDDLGKRFPPPNPN